jgi:hypothetical protein
MRWRSRGVCRVPASRGEPLQLQPEFGELRGIARALGRCSGTRLAPLLTFSRFDLLFDIRKAFAVHIETALFKLNECSSPELRPSLQPLKDIVGHARTMPRLQRPFHGRQDGSDFKRPHYLKPLSRTETSAKRTKALSLERAASGAVAPHSCIEPGHEKWTIDRRRNDGFPPSWPARSRLVPMAPAAAPRPGPPASCPAVRVDDRQTGNEPFMTGLDRARPHRTKPRRRSPDRLHRASDESGRSTAPFRRGLRTGEGQGEGRGSAPSRRTVTRSASPTRAFPIRERLRVAQTTQAEGNRAGTAGRRPLAPFTAD